MGARGGRRGRGPRGTCPRGHGRGGRTVKSPQLLLSASSTELSSRLTLRDGGRAGAWLPPRGPGGGAQTPRAGRGAGAGAWGGQPGTRGEGGTASGACGAGRPASFRAEMPRSRNKTNCRYFWASEKELQLRATHTPRQALSPSPENCHLHRTWGFWRSVTWPRPRAPSLRVACTPQKGQCSGCPDQALPRAGWGPLGGQTWGGGSSAD